MLFSINFLVPYKPYALRTSHFKKAVGRFRECKRRGVSKGKGSSFSFFKLDLENFLFNIVGYKKVIRNFSKNINNWSTEIKSLDLPPSGKFSCFFS